MPAMNTTYEVKQRFPVEKVRKALGIKKLPILSAISSIGKIDTTGIEWYEDEVIGLFTTGTGSGTAQEILDTDTTINVATADVFAIGDIVEIENERVQVTAVDYAANTITVVRGFQGTTAATHPANSKLEVVSSVAAEGNLTGASRVSEPVKHSNVTQVFQDNLYLTGSLEAISPEWAKSEKARQVRQKIFRLDSLKARSIWYGIRFDSTSEKKRTMGGINFYVANKVDAGGAALTPDMIIDQIIAMNNDGVFDMGLMPEIWVNPSYQKVINTWWDSKVLVEREDEKVGRKILKLVTNQGDIAIKYDRTIKEGDLFLIDPAEVKKATLRPDGMEKLAKTDDGQKYLLLEEFTIKVEYPSAWRKLENIAAP